MNALDRLKESSKRILEDDVSGFAVDIKLTSPTGFSIETKGLHSKHHLGMDTQGNRVNTKNAHASFYEKTLIDLGYTVRNSSGEVSLIKHLVEAKDSTGTVKKYIIRETYPDETLGVIICILGDFK